MAKVRIEEIVDHLNTEMLNSLEAAVKEVMPGAQFDATALFRAFRRAVGRKCSTWESVPDRFIE